MDKNSDKNQLAIGKKTFLSSVLILLALMIISGILTRVVPTGSYERMVVDGKTVVNPESFRYINEAPLPIWKWFTAPIEVLFSEDGLVVIVIILFILIAGGSISILNQSNVLNYIINKIVIKYEKDKYKLLAIIAFSFMILGSVVGIFEEAILLVPTIIPLAYILGWDSLVGLGMSLLAVGFGFSAATTNPFTVVVAQRLADVPILSGLWLRAIIFVVIYFVFTTFLIKYAKKIEKNPKLSLVYEEDKKVKNNISITSDYNANTDKRLGKAVKWFIYVMLLMLIIVIGGSFIEAISDYTFPIIGLLFLIAGVGSGLISGKSKKQVFKSFIDGSKGVAPGVLLILMASGVKHIISTGKIMDTIIHTASLKISGMSSYSAIIVVYFLVMFLNFFIGSATAKAFILMPILTPLADILNINRQVITLAFQFGDGFSNVMYPTNAVLLICLGFSVVSYPKWLKWSIKIQLITMAIVMLFLIFAVSIGYGPI